jgi:hypothetical protein
MILVWEGWGWQDADIILVTIVTVPIPDDYHIGEYWGENSNVAQHKLYFAKPSSK